MLFKYCIIGTKRLGILEVSWVGHYVAPSTLLILVLESSAFRQEHLYVLATSELVYVCANSLQIGTLIEVLEHHMPYTTKYICPTQEVKRPCYWEIKVNRKLVY